MTLFRPARPASFAWNLTKTAVQSALFWIAFLWIAPRGLVALEHTLDIAAVTFPGHRVTGAALFVAFGLLNIASGITMARIGAGTPLPLDMPNRLVVAGPYRWVRNPMAVGGLGAGFAVGVFWGSPLTLLYVVAGGVIWHVFVRPVEERDLEKRFGQPYLDYCHRVRCWIPRRPRRADGPDEAP